MQLKKESSMFPKILENRSWVVIFIIILAAIGMQAATQLAVDAVPDVSPVQVLINTKTSGLDPEQVEKSVTYKIESEVSGISGIKEIRSISKFGLSQVIVVFEDGTDIYRARQLLSEKIQSIQGNIPAGLTPELGPISTGLGEVFFYNLLVTKGSELEKKTEKEQLTYLRTINDYVIRPYLKTHIKGIADVDVQGGYKREIHIDFIPSKMKEYGITLEDIIVKIKDLGENFGGGYIEKDINQLIVRTQGNVNFDILKQLPIKLNAIGGKVSLSTIAVIREDSKQRLGFATYNGKETVLGTVLMLTGANSRTVAAQAEKAIKGINLPDDIEINIGYNRKNLVNRTLATLAKNLSEGAALVVIILFFVMGNIRAALLVSLGIPLSLFGAFIGMKYLDISANLMSLGAMDFGVLIDGSVVMIENLVRHLEHNKKKFNTFQEKVDLIILSANEVKSSLIMGLSIIMMVYLPILTLEGVEGKMFKPMALTILVALFTSLIVAIIFMPVLAYIFIKKPKEQEHAEPKIFRIIKSVYNPILNYVTIPNLKNRIVLLTGATLLLIISFSLFATMGSNFMPPLDEGDMVLNITHKTSINLNESLRRQVECEKVIKKFSEVKHVFSRVGVSESATDPAGINMSDTFIILYDKDDWKVQENGKRRTKLELFNDIKKSLQPIIENADITNAQPIEMRFNEVLEGSRADISLRIYGRDLDTLENIQKEALSILKTIDGILSVQLDPLTSLHKNTLLNIELDHSKMNLYNVYNSDVAKSMQIAMTGITLGSYYEYDWRFPIVLKMLKEIRNDPKEIANIPITLSEEGESGSLPFGQVAHFTEKESVISIARSNSRRYAGVGIYLGDKDVVSFINEAKAKMEQKLKLKDGYELQWGGQFENLERSKKRFLIVIPITLLAIFVLLYQNFKSLRMTLMIYLSIPFAVTGGIIALYVRGISLSVSASIGFIALSGIAILNGMMLLGFIKHLQEEGFDIIQAVREGAMMRLRPVSMTAMVACLGFLPMAFNTGLGAEVQRPLATVVIGGLISSTTLTLVFLPMLYIWFMDNNSWVARKKKKSN